MALNHYLQITDKWSLRRFAVKLDSPTQLKNVGEMFDYLNGLSEKDIANLVEQKKIGDINMAGLEDIRTSMFELNDNGTLQEKIEGIKIKQRGKVLSTSDALQFESRQTSLEGYANIMVADLILDRDDVLYDDLRNWKGFNKRRWDNNPEFKEFVQGIVASKYGPEKDRVLSLNTTQDKLDFLGVVSDVVHNSPYETYSRFIGRKLKFRNGPDALLNIMSGRGGNCAEKASAIDFIAKNYGLEGRVILGGDEATGNFPYNTLRHALDNFNFTFKRDAQNYWSHHANSFEIEPDKYLFIDATGGSMPKIFAFGEEADAYFRQEKGLPVRFIGTDEQYFYHNYMKNGQDISDIAYHSMLCQENLLDEIDIHHVLGEDDSQFGFVIGKDFWVGLTMFKTESEFNQYKKDWQQWAKDTSNIGTLEVYANMDPSAEKGLLTKLESSNPQLIADIRSAGPYFLERCKTVWRENDWKNGYIFAQFK